MGAGEPCRARPAAHRAGRPNVFRLVDGTWQLAFDGREVHVPDAKGLRDIAMLIGAQQRPVHIYTLLDREAPATGADPVLDRRAVAEFRGRLAALQAEIDDADGDPYRAGRARAERDAVVAELRAATGMGGRARRLGDEAERARKTVTARIRDAVRGLDTVHPALATHLRAALQTGTCCTYAPGSHQRWRL